jgi:hypothetical protein
MATADLIPLIDAQIATLKQVRELLITTGVETVKPTRALQSMGCGPYVPLRAFRRSRSQVAGVGSKQPPLLVVWIGDAIDAASEGLRIPVDHI